MLQKLLRYKPENRIGCRDLGAVEIREHPFFRGVDWAGIGAKNVEPPFKPEVEGDDDFSNFDTVFTEMNVEQTPTDKTSKIF